MDVNVKHSDVGKVWVEDSKLFHQTRCWMENTGGWRMTLSWKRTLITAWIMLRDKVPFAGLNAKSMCRQVTRAGNEMCVRPYSTRKSQYSDIYFKFCLIGRSRLSQRSSTEWRPGDMPLHVVVFIKPFNNFCGCLDICYSPPFLCSVFTSPNLIAKAKYFSGLNTEGPPPPTHTHTFLKVFFSLCL